MGRKIIVTVEAEIEFEATEKEEELMKKIDELLFADVDDYKTYDKLNNKLNNLVMERVEREMAGVAVQDIYWDD